jgi:hypothetical protein
MVKSAISPWWRRRKGVQDIEKWTKIRLDVLKGDVCKQ